MQYTFSLHETVWGYVAAAWSTAGLWELTFPLASPIVAKDRLFSAISAEAKSDWVDLLDRELKAYFAQTLTEFSTPVDWSGYTSFRAAVLRYTASIPFGQLRTYGQAAAAAGSPKGARAAGGALHNNRTPIIVPCHRVVGSNGDLTGFGGGLAMKTALLQLEKRGQAG